VSCTLILAITTTIIIIMKENALMIKVKPILKEYTEETEEE
jgi:hypothetical protein